MRVCAHMRSILDTISDQNLLRKIAKTLKRD